MPDDLVVEYQRSNDHEQVSCKLPPQVSLKRKSPITFNYGEEDEFARLKKTKTRRMNVKSELDLEEDPLPDDHDLNVLRFWQKNRKYPTLRKIARDILVIPISTVASESTFSMGGRVISPHHSKLHAKTVEAPMCLLNWIIDDVKGNIFCTFLKIGWKG